MESRIVNMASGNTIRTIKNPIRWLFTHDRQVVSFEVKALQHGEGFLVAYMDDNTMLKMTWASYRVMMDSMLKTRAWRNHFGGMNINKRDLHSTTTYTI